jgi:hypothetical protein
MSYPIDADYLLRSFAPTNRGGHLLLETWHRGEARQKRRTGRVANATETRRDRTHRTGKSSQAHDRVRMTDTAPSQETK